MESTTADRVLLQLRDDEVLFLENIVCSDGINATICCSGVVGCDVRQPAAATAAAAASTTSVKLTSELLDGDAGL